MAESVGALLHGVLTHAATQHQPIFTLQRRWKAIIGERLARHTKPLNLRRGTLVIQADRPGDGHAVQYQRLQILQRINKVLPGRVEELVIRPGERSER